MSDALPTQETEDTHGAKIKLTLEIEGRIAGLTTVKVTALAVKRDGSIEEQSDDNPTLEAETFIGGILLASQELRKLGVLLGLDIIGKVASRVGGTGEGIENAHAAAEYAAGEES
jgi:hypothetical protein